MRFSVLPLLYLYLGVHVQSRERNRPGHRVKLGGENASNRGTGSEEAYLQFCILPVALLIHVSSSHGW